jgi:hypothetical protein
MSLRCLLLSILLVSFTFAADQTSGPAKPDPTTQPAKISTPAESNPPAQADSQGSHSRIHFGGLSLGAGYSHVAGPAYWGGYSPYYRYDPILWAPYYHPGYYTGFTYGPNLGNIKIQAPDKTSLVYLDGALAGRLDKLKDMWLEPGAYQLEVRNASHRLTQKIYVLSGKTLKVTADMMADEVLR